MNMTKRAFDKKRQLKFDENVISKRNYNILNMTKNYRYLCSKVCIILGRTSDKENQRDPLEVEFVNVDGLDKDALDQDTLTVLGKNGEPTKMLGDPIQKDIACQWHTDIIEGLKIEVKENLCKKYQIPNNLEAAQPPKLNPEIKAALSEACITRDNRLEKVQAQMGLSLSALGKAQTILLGSQKEEGGEKLLPVIEAVNDAARLLADIYHEQSVSRQNVACINLDKSVKDMLQDAKLDQWLFGDKLGERFKAAKAIEKSGQELKRPSLSKGKLKPGSSKNFKPFPGRRRSPGTQKYHHQQNQPKTKTPWKSRRIPHHYKHSSERSTRQHH